MANPYTVSNLVAAVQDMGMLPVSDPAATSNRIINIMNREQRTYLMRTLLSAREEYQTDHVDITLTSTQTKFRIPARAVGTKLKMVELIQQGATGIPIHPIPREMLYWYVVSGINGGYYFEGNSLYPIQPGLGVSQLVSAVLRITYFRRFGQLVSESAVGLSSSVNFNTGVIGIDTSTYAVPATFTTSALFDIVQGNPPFDVLAQGIQPSAVASPNITFPVASLPTDMVAGDYVCLQGQTAICQAPLEFHDLLVQRAVVKYLEALGDPKMQVAKAMMDELKQDVLSLVEPRVEGHSEILINYNAPGWQRGSKRRRRRLF